MKRLLAFFLTVSAIVPVHAQELIPLSQMLSSATPAYPFQRCAGLYLAVSRQAGEDKLGKDTFRSLKMFVDVMVAASAATAVRSGGGGSREHVMERTIRDVEILASRYLTRFEQNLDDGGRLFFTDGLVKDDMQTCKRLASAAKRVLK